MAVDTETDQRILIEERKRRKSVERMALSAKSEKFRARSIAQGDLNTWLFMLWQLRFASKDVPNIPPGNCQAMLDYLISREVALAFNDKPPLYRHGNTRLMTKHWGHKMLSQYLPTEQVTNRDPRSFNNHPIFLRYKGKILLIDGRRRINYWLDQPDRLHAVWVISEI